MTIIEYLNINRNIEWTHDLKLRKWTARFVVNGKLLKASDSTKLGAEAKLHKKYEKEIKL